MKRIEEDELKATNDIMSDMTRQFKSTQEELLKTEQLLT